MNELQIFNYDSKEIRTIQIKDVIWWIAKDVCNVLDIQNTTQAIKALDEDERSMFLIGRQGQTNVINESVTFFKPSGISYVAKRFNLTEVK